MREMRRLERSAGPSGCATSTAAASTYALAITTTTDAAEAATATHTHCHGINGDVNWIANRNHELNNHADNGIVRGNNNGDDDDAE